jgi:hypothetical protein
MSISDATDVWFKHCHPLISAATEWQKPQNFLFQSVLSYTLRFVIRREDGWLRVQTYRLYKIFFPTNLGSKEKFGFIY